MVDCVLRVAVVVEEVVVEYVTVDVGVYLVLRTVNAGRRQVRANSGAPDCGSILTDKQHTVIIFSSIE